MSMTVKMAEKQLDAMIRNAIAAATAAGELPEGELPAYVIEVPADRTHGDLASNVAMVSARAFRAAPRKIADAIVAHLELGDTYFEKAEVAGPGFLNFFLSPAYYGDIVAEAQQKGETFGHSDYGNGHKVMVEYVSANPTGPMHMGNARGGALGDCLASVLDAAGYEVWREFYINDAGNQIEKFAYLWISAINSICWARMPSSCPTTPITATTSRNTPPTLPLSTATSIFPSPPGSAERRSSNTLCP